MLTALVLASVTAVIASSFLFRAAQEVRLATRSYFQSVALNLAEAGIEEGLHAANGSGFTSANGWTLVSGSTTDYRKAITSGFNFQQATGELYVRVDQATTLSPVVLALGVVRIPQQPVIVKQLRVSGSKRHLWANGLVVKGTLTFSGTTSIDSYDSHVGVYNAATNRSDQATVATTSTATDPVVVGSNASIYGYVATGSAEPNVGSGGRIYGSTTPAGTLVDETRIRHDFTANLPDATAPSGTAIALGTVSSSLALPRTGDTAGADGRYLYSVPSINLSGGDALSITGPVDLIVAGGVSVSGTAQISIGASGANQSLNLYCPGTISISGNGMANLTNDPSKVTIWGTAASPAEQSISVGGNAAYTGTVYAPNGNLTLNGNGGTSGAVIAKTATISGNGQFHYDVQLANTQTSMDASFRITAWCELTGVVGGGSAFARDNREPFAALF